MSEYKIVTQFNKDIIIQDTYFDDQVDHYARQIIKLKEDGVKHALIELGWIPPEEKEKLIELGWTPPEEKEENEK